MKHQYLKNVSTLKFMPDKCIGCGMCMDVCPHRVFDIKENKAQVIDKDSCMECGACAKNCPAGAIEVKTGVGCAYAIIMGKLMGTEPNCDSDCCCGKENK